MDDFMTGPSDFHLHFNSSDESTVTKQNGGYTLQLKKPLEFAGEWEVSIKQIIVKTPFINKNSLSYKSPDNPDESTFSKFFSLGGIKFPDNVKDLISTFNSSVPESLKTDLSLNIDADNYAVLNVKNTQVKFNSPYLTDVLGFKLNTVYPNVFPTQNFQVKSERKINTCPVFYVESDFTVPETYGSRILCIDVFSSVQRFVSYKYEN